MKTFIISAFVLTFLFWGTAFAQEPVFVEPLTSIGIQTSEAAEGGLSSYINRLYQYGVGLGAILAVLIIIYGGFRYMTSEAVGQKSAGREDIQRAVLGLLLVMSPVIVFSVINTNILNLDFGLQRIGDALEGSRGSGGAPVEDGSCSLFATGNTPIGDATDRRCCSIQGTTQAEGGLISVQSCNVVFNSNDEEICNCGGGTFEHWATLPITDSFGADTGELCREERISNHPSIASCQRQENLFFGGTTNTANFAQTKGCLGEVFSPPRPASVWSNIQSLPICQDVWSENPVVSRYWRGKPRVHFVSASTGNETNALYPGAAPSIPLIRINPTDPTGSTEEQEAECFALTSPEALFERFNTQEVRDTLGAESITLVTTVGGINDHKCDDI